MFLSYTLRGLIARRATVFPTMLAIIATVGAIVVMQALVAGLTNTVSESGSPNNAVVLSAGADNDAGGSITLPTLQRISTLPDIAQADGAALVSGELVVANKFKRPDSHIALVNLRGVDPVAFKVHQGVRIVEGKLPENHELGCLIGAKRVGQIPAFKTGGTVRVGRRDWPITGVISAPSTQFESELWCDRQALMDETKHTAFSVVYVRLTTPAAQEPFAFAIRGLNQNLDSFAEPVHFRRSISSIDVYLNAMLIISLVLAIGATLACINAVYLSFLSRSRELATLIAIGFTRWRVAMIALQDSLAMTLLAGGIGLGLGCLIHGRSFGMEEISLIYSARVTPLVLAFGVATTLAIGVLGAIAAVVHAMRMQVLIGLRAL